MYNLSIVLEDSARARADHTALIIGPRRISFAETNGAANMIANGLAAHGIGAGDTVALCCPNLPYFPMIYYAVLKAGATILPVNVLLTDEEIAYLLEDSGAKAFFCFEGTNDLPIGSRGHAAFENVSGCAHFWMITADPAATSPIEGVATLGALMAQRSPMFDTVQRSGEDIAVVLYTSGTTGHPKGAELTHTNILLNAIISRDLTGAKNDDICMITLPLFHVFGQVVLMVACTMAGTTMVLVPRFDPAAVLKTLQDDEVTIFAGVPTMYWALLNHPAEGVDLAKIKKNLRICASGGASLPVEVLRGFEEKFEVAILEGYGLSETSPVVTFNHQDKERKPGSVGTPVWGVEVRVVDENDADVAAGDPGEIIVRGHCVMKGYFNRPEATAEAFRGGWFHTGDIGHFDEDGYLFIVDRLKDMIIRGGFNVYPRELEEVLMTHPDVSLVAVIGVPHDEYGEDIKAFVVPKPNHQVDGDALIEWSKGHLAAYKYPRQIEVRESLPMNATGKILKKELRE